MTIKPYSFMAYSIEGTCSVVFEAFISELTHGLLSFGSASCAAVGSEEKIFGGDSGGFGVFRGKSFGNRVFDG